jgi:hypothetical protein
VLSKSAVQPSRHNSNNNNKKKISNNDDDEQSNDSGEAPRTPVSGPPRTPKTYTQLVDKRVPNRMPAPVLTPASGKGGGFFQSFMDMVVGDTIELGKVLKCEKCEANNGLVAEDKVPDVWVCRVCDYENKKPESKKQK